MLAATSMAPSCAPRGDGEDDAVGVAPDSKRGLRHGAAGAAGMIIVHEGEKTVPASSFSCLDAPPESPGFLSFDPDTGQGIRCLTATEDEPPTLEVAPGETLRVLTSGAPGGIVVAGVPPGFRVTNTQGAPRLPVIATAVQADKAGKRWDVRLPAFIEYPRLQFQRLSATPGVGPVTGYEVAVGQE